MIIKKDEFSNWVENRRKNTKESYMDTVLEACSQFSIEIEMVGPLLNQQIVGKIQAEATDLNYFKRENFSLQGFL